MPARLGGSPGDSRPRAGPPRARWRAGPLPLVANAVVLLLLALGLAVLSLDAEPALAEPKPLTSAEKRHIVELFQGKNPRKVPPGETRPLRLTGAELDRLPRRGARPP